MKTMIYAALAGFAVASGPTKLIIDTDIGGGGWVQLRLAARSGLNFCVSLCLGAMM